MDKIASSRPLIWIIGCQPEHPARLPRWLPNGPTDELEGHPSRVVELSKREETLQRRGEKGSWLGLDGSPEEAMAA